MDINSVIDSVSRFYSRLYYQTGLESWQLLIIALGVLLILVLLLSYVRKARLKKVHVIKSTNRSETIGINLAGGTSGYSPHHKYRTTQTSFAAEEDEDQKSWGQSTKDWRKLREKIRHLQHDISKHEKSEKHLKEQITGLISTNKKLQSELDRRSQLEEELKQHIDNLTAATLDQKQEAIENRLTDKIKPEIKDIQTTSESSEIIQEHKDSTQINPEPEQIPEVAAEQETSVSDFQTQIMENQSNPTENFYTEDLSQADETTERDHGIPLDIKELKAIADLAKRLQARGQQRQNQ